MGPPLMKKQKTDNETPTEAHDSGFVEPLAMFKPIPINNTFMQSREQTILAHPIDPTAETYTFMFRGNPFGVLKTSDAKFYAKMKFQTAAGANPAGNLDAIMTPFPLRTIWGKRTVYLNNSIVSNSSHIEHIVACLRLRTLEIPEHLKDNELITMGIFPTSNRYDVVNFGSVILSNNANSRRLQRRFNAGAQQVVIDTVDLTCFNENGGDRYLPSDFEFKVELRRNTKTKYLHGVAADCQGVELNINNFEMRIPMLKPNDQISAAINGLMIGKDLEIHNYQSQYRTVVRPLNANVTDIQEIDIFTNAKPTRLFVIIMANDRYAGDHTLHQFKWEHPEFTSAKVLINSGEIYPPEYKNYDMK